MKYSVLWLPSAEKLLAKMWLEADDRAEVQKAADELDRILGEDGLHAGESRVSNIRIIIEPPLAAYFDVYEADRRVKVWRVWRVRGK